MFGGSGRIKLLAATYAALFCAILRCCIAEDEHTTAEDCASSCGNIHNISYPFRLQTDPKHCGEKEYELACVANAVILSLIVSEEEVVRYRVQAINYNNLTIRLVDPNVFMDNCTFPVRPSLYTYAHSIYSPQSILSPYTYINQDLIFESCPFPMTGKLVEFNTSCTKVAYLNYHFASHSKRYWYVHVGSTDYFDLENSCRIEYKYWTSLLPEGANNISNKDVNNSLAYGFELSWDSKLVCCASGKYDCSRGNLLYLCSSGFTLADFLRNMPFYLEAVLVFYAMYKGLLCFCGTPCVIAFLMYKLRRRHFSAYDNIEEFLRCDQNNLMPIRYSYSQIRKMTNGFKEKLGEEGYGSVFKGKLRSGNLAAVKMLKKSKADGQEFINEVATIGRIHHTNVVQLIGFCVEGSKRALVYEFMVNGSLDKHVFSKEGCIPLNNEQIYDICLGVAHGIKYLHQGCDIQILHFDIKPHNILLDENFVPKISDFGLAKLHTTDKSIVSLTAARGTIGYMAPEFFYKNIGHISYKADVYSFGMLLMEMVGKRKNLNAFTEHSSRIYFPSWIYDQMSTKKEIKLGDGSKEESTILKKIIIIALWCIQLNPIDRPSMHNVIKMLEADVENLQIPPKPFASPLEVC